MKKYRRKPKTLWQRVWFKIKPQIITVERTEHDHFAVPCYKYKNKEGDVCIDPICIIEDYYEPFEINNYHGND